jgi:SAM-dependent methyltransferase
MRTRRFCRIDKTGCIACGGRTFEGRPVIDDALASAWGLSAQERADFDEREGQACTTCQMSKRVRMLLWSIRRLFPVSSNLQVLHFNQINHLSGALRGLGAVTETCFQEGVERGATANGLVNEDICALTLPDQFFDLAIHSETLEHLFNFNRALSEVGRVLKPGGIQIYTVPLIHNRSTRQRMQQTAEGGVVHLLRPSFHGNEGEFPVVWEFGGDFFEHRKPNITELDYDNYWQNRTVFTVVERKP